LLVQLGVPRHEAGDEAGRVAVEGIDGGVDGRRRPERDLRAPLPLPFAAQLGDIDRLGPRLRHLFLGAGYRSGLSPPAVELEVVDDVELRARAPPLRRPAQPGENRLHPGARAFSHYDGGVERVAHLTVER